MAAESLPQEFSDKHTRLLDVLGAMRRVVVAFSGGVDSAVVAKAAFLTLGHEATAVTADSPSVSRSDLDDAIRVAKQIGIPHRVIKTQEFADSDYLRNDGARCYHCKSELYSQLDAIRREMGDVIVVSGANLDDAGD